MLRPGVYRRSAKARLNGSLTKLIPARCWNAGDGTVTSGGLPSHEPAPRGRDGQPKHDVPPSHVITSAPDPAEPIWTPPGKIACTPRCQSENADAQM